ARVAKRRPTPLWGGFMRLIDSITITSQGGTHSIELYEGDVTKIPAEQAVDLLVVSAFPNDYYPTPRSVIGSLAEMGVSVAELAEDKEVDLRQFSSCWLSKLLPR